MTRLIQRADAVALAVRGRSNAAFFAPWDPERSGDFYTEESRGRMITDLLASHSVGDCLPYVIVDDDLGVVGQVTLYNTVRGYSESAEIGYWVAAEANGRGLATSAVAHIVGIAFGDLGLHRVHAETLPHNVRSRRVLERNGFEQYGLAPGYLKIAGQWRDHVLYQRLNPDDDKSQTGLG